MTKNNNSFSRRRFVKGLGLAAAFPILPGSIFSEKAEYFTVAGADSHMILSCNIRVALSTDDEAGVGWESRKELCIEIIRAQNPDLICFQEVLEVQNEDLKKAFPNFFSFGFEGPEMDAHKEGYHGIAKNPIFFSTEKYELVSAGTYWLSETPHIGGSKSWGTARARHVNWVRLKEKGSSNEFRVVNLHLDHVSQQAREKQTNMMLEEAAQYPEDFKQILAGDFNASAENNVINLIKDNGWTDTYTTIHGDAEPGATVHVFLGENDPKKDKRKKIDFIFTRGGEIKSGSATIIKDHKNGVYPSDHYFLSAKVKM